MLLKLAYLFYEYQISAGNYQSNSFFNQIEMGFELNDLYNTGTGCAPPTEQSSQLGGGHTVSSKYTENKV